MRHWPSLIAAAADLIDGRRWNLTPGQVRQALLIMPSTFRGVFEYYGRKADPGFAARADVTHQIEAAWRDLVGAGEILIAGTNAATGATVSLPAAVAAAANFRFDANEVVLPGVGGARVLVGAVSERKTGEAERARPKKMSGAGIVRNYVATTYPDGIIPADITYKHIARATQTTEGMVRGALRKKT
jgi:hypothetical protein